MANRKARRAAARRAGILAHKPAISQPSSVQQTLHATATADSALPELNIPNNPQVDIPEPGHPFPKLETISAAQLAANRANAQFSSGPRTEAGRAISSQNRVTHGLTRHNNRFVILDSEDPDAFDALKQRLAEEHQPGTETESELVSDMAEARWLKERAQRLQANTFKIEDGEVQDPKMFQLYVRYEQMHNRNFYRALTTLVNLRETKRKAENGFEAQRVKTAALEMKKDLHYWNTLKKDAETCHQIALNTALQLEEIAKNPDFPKHYAAELAKFKLKPGAMNTAEAA